VGSVAVAGWVVAYRPDMADQVELRPDYPLITRRLRLRPLSAADTEDLVAYRSLEDVCRYVPFEPMDAAAVAEKLDSGWSRQAITAEGEAVTLGVELAEIGRLIGDVMLFFTSAEHRGGEIGWVLHPGYSRHGYATEASHAVLHLAFDQLGLHRVIARVDARNDASMRLGERLGMRREAHLVSNEWFKGAWSDEVDLALLDSEWAAQHAEGQRRCSWPLASPSLAMPQ
jgi:RimJ/RimL family protein N-acetyltransferase